ncbi:MAG: family 43 glycosylhydrolase [Clostridia bacterium]|nr:family 43 glycosylhydrolase [Clostridia bacterium]
MKKLVYFLFSLIFVFTMITVISAKEIAVYENDFSGNDISELVAKGSWEIQNGMLTTGSGSGSAFLTYTIPDEYAGCDYQVDVDFIGHTSTGGVLIGATAAGVTPTPKEFHGFDCFTGSAGDKAALGLYKLDGSWKGNIAVSGSVMASGCDLHITVRVTGNKLTYRLQNIDRTMDYYGIEYTVGQSDKEVYEALTRTVGLRKFYSDNGYFDNFKVSVFANDVIPSMSKKVTLGDTEFSTDSVSVKDSATAGSGTMLTNEAMASDFKASFMLSPKNDTKILFGMTDEKNGYAFEINKKYETVSFYEIKDGKYTTLGHRVMPVGDGTYLTYVAVNGNIATAFFDAYSNGEGTFPMFEFELKEYKAGKFGFILEGATVSDFAVGASAAKTGELYLNPIFDGADPEIIYHEGTYYAYRRVSEGTNVVRAYSSPDLINWTDRGIVYKHLDNYTGNTYMSPNVIYNKPDGLFYLFLAGKNAEKTSSCIYYAYGESPLGPFVHVDGKQTTLHEIGISEIGGAPFVDEDGKLYLTFCRFGGGNHIYIEQFEAMNGIVKPVNGTLRKIMSPTEYYEIDGHGNIAEGGIITKHNGTYYMIMASGHYLGNYGASYAYADNILGPYTRYDYNEIMSHNAFVDGVGDCIFIKSPDQSELWVAYHQHKEVGTVELRRTRIDKVQFVKDVNGGPDIMTINGPSTTPQAVPSNIYKYDINRDGKKSLYDVLLAIKYCAESKEYSGIYDFDGNGRINMLDLRKLVNAIV